MSEVLLYPQGPGVRGRFPRRTNARLCRIRRYHPGALFFSFWFTTPTFFWKVISLIFYHRPTQLPTTKQGLVRLCPHTLSLFVTPFLLPVFLSHTRLSLSLTHTRITLSFHQTRAFHGRTMQSTNSASPHTVHSPRSMVHPPPTQVWDAATGALFRTIHTGPSVYSVAFGRDWARDEKCVAFAMGQQARTLNPEP